MKTTLIAFVLFILGSDIGKAQTLAAAKAQLTAAMHQFRALPKDPPLITPPSIEMKCGELTRFQQSQMNKYDTTLQEPERSIIIKIVAIGKIFEQLNSPIGLQTALDSACKVFTHLENRLIKTINEYAKDKRYFIPISSAANRIDKEGRILGCQTSYDMIMGILSQKGRDITNELLKGLISKHDYSLAKTIMYYDKTCILFGNYDKGFFPQLANALTFEIKIEQEVEYYRLGVYWGKYKAEGTETVIVNARITGVETATGKAKMKLLVCEKTDMCQKGDGGDEIQCTSKCALVSYPIPDFTLLFDACDKNEMTLKTIGNFGPELEDWTVCYDSDFGGGKCGSTHSGKERNQEQTRMSNDTYGVLVKAGLQGSVAQSYTNPELMYARFVMPLQNNNAEAGRIEIANFMENNNMGLKVVLKLNFIITHTPK